MMSIIAPLAMLAAATVAAPAQMTVGEGTGTLHGTLLSPAKGGTGGPAVLILAGSGPTDRDGNSPLGVSAAPYRLLAEALSSAGIPALRADKRGIAASAAAMTSEDALRVQTYAADARSWAKALRERTGARCVWLLGHSEGTLHALIAAQESEGLCGLILVSPVGRPLGEILRAQFRSLPAFAPMLDEAMRILAELEAGRTVPGEGMNPALMSIFRPSVQPFLISMLAADPPALAAAYHGPILVVQGTTDLQTAVADAERLGQARGGIKVALIEGMNHVLKIAPADPATNLATYANPDLPLAPGLVDTIVDFIRANQGAEKAR
ncbi:alpha/beta hydrolase [Sphingomonas colocasiae]|uniref:Lysophospholipase n=1 Tax=Sphingomonas colocasiae TaxID=1848973 RepID=A0ABS7PJH9_9SPHN|nr:alpha/beta fold hydrolase [Sphingomonas colocasiae]MBY8821450.1 lysophospholipase [Sphingomonas colocasiae]